ncbi:MAG: hypothetical protein J6B07_04350, partial [Opitutales bacterium]|nr:hypothetical protein [Opitutales bacterium]
RIKIPKLVYGNAKNEATLAHTVFSVLREVDGFGVKSVFIHAPSKQGVGLAVYNRLIRATGFKVIHLSKTVIGLTGPTGAGKSSLRFVAEKKGFYVVADAAGCRVLILRFIPKYYLTIPSWDKFVIPLPFSSVKIETMEFENTKQMAEFATKCGKTPEQIVTDFCNGVIEGN